MAKRSRSPSYPGISLERAIELAGKLHGRILHHSSARTTIIDHLGYSARSSSGMTTFAALKQFGLLDAEHGGDAKLSKLALDIVLDDREGSRDRAAAIRKAALIPAFYKALWEKYDGLLPDDADIRLFLTRDKQFTPHGAMDFIGQFRATIEFANLGASDATSEDRSINGGSEFSEGDYIQWEKNGVLQLPEACKIAGFYGPEHVVLEGSSIVVPVDELIVDEPPGGQLAPPPTLRVAVNPGSGAQMKQATLPLDEGMMMFQWSSPLSKSSKKLAGVWIDRIVKELIEATDDQQSSEPVAQQESDD